jgi:hypothetical protein
VSGFSSGPRLRLTQRNYGYGCSGPGPQTQVHCIFCQTHKTRKPTATAPKAAIGPSVGGSGALEPPGEGAEKGRETRAFVRSGAPPLERGEGEEGGGSKARLPVGSQTRNRKKYVLEVLGIGAHG